jgi:hypothetical protein
MGDNEPDRIKNATRTTFPKKLSTKLKIQAFFENVLWVATIL